MGVGGDHTTNQRQLPRPARRRRDAAPRLPRSHSGEAHNPRSYRGGSRSTYSFASFRPIPVSVRTILIASICCPAATSERSSSS